MITLLIATIAGVACCLCGADVYRRYQMCGYRAKEMFSRECIRDSLVGIILGVIGTVVCAILSFVGLPNYGYAVFAGLSVICLIVILLRKRTLSLRFTPRCIRLVLFVLALDLIYCCTVLFLTNRSIFGYGALCILHACQVPLTLFAGFILGPIEGKIQIKYMKRAKTRLQEVAPFVIGVTGSFGKTTVKNMIATILSEKFSVCASPASYNTPMGLCRTILEQLKTEDEIFVAEMGARYRGDIVSLCNFVEPDLAVITGIGNQHLSTFGSKADLMNEKYELVRHLRNGGAAFFAEDEGSFALYKRGYYPSYTTRMQGTKYSFTISDLRTGRDGSRFVLKKDGVSVTVKTALIGSHNVANLRLAIMVALSFGLTLQEIASGIGKLKPIPHRLQLLPASSTMQVIDDSYNGSLEGICAAMSVLSMFAPKRVVITPGVIECGADTYATNYRCGMSIGAVADHVFVYGPNAKALCDGMSCVGLSEYKMDVVGSRNQAVDRVKTLAFGYVTLIFCNDLPV